MTETLQRESAVPLYAQLEQILRAKIDSGEWQSEQRIPSENELNKIYGLSRMTARGVLTRLVNDGLLFRVPGKGTFVAPQKISAVSPAYRGVREQLEAMGYETVTELIDAGRVQPSAAVRDKLRLEVGEEVHSLARLRSVQGEPISFHRSFVPARLASGLDELDTVNEQLCVVLENSFGLSMKFVEENLEAVSVTAEEAEILRVRRGAPVLLLEDTISDAGHRPFEYSKILFRGDKIRIHFNFEL